jgi:site-specific DNA recombinase
MQGEQFPVVLYARKSEIRDPRSASVDEQLTALCKWAAREGWPVIGKFRDDNISASWYAEGKERPGWAQAMEVVTSGQVRGLLVWEFSRGTRDMEVYAALNKACRMHRVQLGYGNRLHDLNSSAEAFAVGMDALSAARHSDETSERVRRAAEGRAARGWPHGALPDGYRRIIDPRTGRVAGHEADSERAAFVQEVVRRLLARESADSIAADLHRRGIRSTTGKQLRGTSLTKLARNPAYAGLRVYHGKVRDDVEASWPAIITPEDHYRIRLLFDDPQRDKYRNPTHVKYLGSGIYRCGRAGCEGRMRVVAYRYGAAYGCRECHKVSRRQAPVDEWVEAVMVTRLSRPDALELLASPDRSQQRQEAAAEVIRLEAEELDIQRALERREITVRDMSAWRRGWEPLIVAARATARPPVMDSAVTGLTGPDAEARWNAALIGVRRVVLDALAVVTILPTGRRGGTPQPFNPDLVRIEWRGGNLCTMPRLRQMS